MRTRMLSDHAACPARLRGEAGRNLAGASG